MLVAENRPWPRAPNVPEPKVHGQGPRAEVTRRDGCRSVRAALAARE